MRVGEPLSVDCLQTESKTFAATQFGRRTNRSVRLQTGRGSGRICGCPVKKVTEIKAFAKTPLHGIKSGQVGLDRTGLRIYTPADPV